jgi:hypothetical protein
MSKSHEHDAAAAVQGSGSSRDGEVGDSGNGTPGATDKVTRGTGDAGAPGATHHAKGPGRDGEVGSGGGGTPPATDPPTRGGN